MKSYAGGKRKAKRRWIGRWSVCLWVGLLPSVALPAVRTLWMFEQLYVQQNFRVKGDSRAYVHAETGNFERAFSSSVSAGIDLWDVVELRLSAAKRLFFSPQGSDQIDTQAFHSGRSTNMHVELSRSAFSSENHFGRINVGFSHFFSNNLYQWVTAGLHTGIVARDNAPWGFQFGLVGTFPVHPDRSTLSIRLLGERLILVRPNFLLSAGIEATGHRRFFSNTPGDGSYELVQLSPGALLSARLGAQEISLKALWRFHIDKQIALGAETQPLTVNALPDFILSWSIGI